MRRQPLGRQSIPRILEQGQRQLAHEHSHGRAIGREITKVTTNGTMNFRLYPPPLAENHQGVKAFAWLGNGLFPLAQPTAGKLLGGLKATRTA